MFNSLLRQHDKIGPLLALVEEIKSTGMVSMESADAIHRLAPGELSNIDPEFMFGMGEMEGDVSIALEGAMEGLSKIKLAFIVAIIAFILKYISTLGSSSYDFSSGGGGGWGGSAPPKFQSTKPPTSPEFNEELKAYEELLDKDIETLNNRLNELVDDFRQELSDKDFLKSMKKNPALTSLITTVKAIVRENGGQQIGGNARGFVTFTDPFWESFTGKEAESDEITDKQISLLPTVMNQIAKTYTPAAIFTRTYVEDATDADKALKTNPMTHQKIETINKLGIPAFVLNKEDRDANIAFITIVSKMIGDASGFKDLLTQVRGFFYDEDKSSPRIGSELSTSRPIWVWLNDNLQVTGNTNTVVRTFVSEIGKVVESEDFDYRDTEYFNTDARAHSIKSFVKRSISGDGRVDDKPGAKQYLVNLEGHEWLSKLLWGSKNDEIGKLFDGVLEPLAKANDLLKDHESDLTALTDTCEKLEQEISKAKRQSHLRHDKMYKQDDDAPRPMTDDNLPANHLTGDQLMAKASTLLNGLVQMLLLSVASTAKYNIELNKLANNRVKLVIGKGQEIATNHAKLIRQLEKLIAIKKGTR